MDAKACVCVCVIAREEARYATEARAMHELPRFRLAWWRWYDDGPTHVTVEALGEGADGASGTCSFPGPLLPCRGRHTRRVVRPSTLRGGCDPSYLPAAHTDRP